MPDWGLLLIQLLVLAGIGLIFWNTPFLCPAAVIGFSIWLIVMSTRNYGEITWARYVTIEVRRFVCVYAVACFACEETYRIKWFNENGQKCFWEFTFIPETFVDCALQSAISAVASIGVFDFLIPFIVGDDFASTFRYGIILGLVFLVPAVVLLAVEIRNLILYIKNS